MMKQTFPELVLRLVLAAAMAAPLAANAIGVQSSTSVKLTFSDCFDPACGGVQRAESTLGGAPGGLSASAAGSSFFYGFASAAVSLSGDIGAPVLRASATQAGFPLTRVSTNSVALQRYTYQGTEVTQRTFGGLLGYSQFISPDTFSGVGAVIELFTMASEFYEVGDSPRAILTPFSPAISCSSPGPDTFPLARTASRTAFQRTCLVWEFSVCL